MKFYFRALVFTILLVGIIVRLLFLFSPEGELDSDEAIVGLMGRHILQGEHPIYYYGQIYMGSLEAYLAAALFFVWGSSTLVLKLVPLFTSVVFIILVFYLIKKLYDKETALIGMLFTALPPYFLSMWSIRARGGYIETLVLGTIILLLVCRILNSEKDRKQIVFLVLLGLVCGLSWWTNQLVIYYIGSSIICLLVYPNGRRVLFQEKIRLWKVTPIYNRPRPHFYKVSTIFGSLLNLLIVYEIIVMFIILNHGGFTIRIGVRSADFHSISETLLWILGFFILYLIFSRHRDLVIPKGIIIFLITFTIGNLPACIYRATFNFPIMGSVIDIKNWFIYFGDYRKIGMPIIIGARKVWDLYPIFPKLIETTLILLYMSFIAYFLVKILRLVCVGRNSLPLGLFLPIVMGLLMPIIFSTTKYRSLIKEPRYLLPIYTVLPIFISVPIMSLIRKRVLRLIAIVIIFFLVLCNLKGNVSYLDKPLWRRNIIPLEDKEVIDFLLQNNIHYAYAHYWTAYKLTFEANEQIIYASLDSIRYPRYNQLLAAQKWPAYIMREGEGGQLEKCLDINKIEYKLKNIGSYQIYYSISLPERKSEKEEYILIIPKDWEACTNTSQYNLQNVFDNNVSTRWTTVINQRPGMYFMIDLKERFRIAKIALTSGESIYDYPRGCKVEVSIDGKEWQTVVSAPEIGWGQFVFPEIGHPLGMRWGWIEFAFIPVETRYIKIVQTGESDDSWWSIHEIHIYTKLSDTG